LAAVPGWLKQPLLKDNPIADTQRIRWLYQDDALSFDAEANIRDGQGKVRDYVRYFRHSQIDRETAEAVGRISRTGPNDACAIAKGASDDVYAAYLGGQITEDKALAISTVAPGNVSTQAAAVDKPAFIALPSRKDGSHFCAKKD
jgi:hypothetical protein